jgi:hypothetical protein
LPRANSPTTRVVKQTHVQSVVASRGYDTNGCDSCGCSQCAAAHGGCRPALLPCVFDNLPDLFICLLPTRAHCCPYPRTCGEPSCCNQPVGCCNQRQPLLNSLFSQRYCDSGCNAPCQSCTAGEAHGMHLMTPLYEELDRRESPFRDDPEMPMQRGARKPSQSTKTTQQQWFKKTDAAPVRYTREGPSMIIVGSASPIRVGE